jgi:ketopantoate hydroxymethyltransferase
MKRVTDFARFRNEARPISMVTCYDAWSASLLARPSTPCLSETVWQW